MISLPASSTLSPASADTGLRVLTRDEARRCVPYDDLARFSRETEAARESVLDWIAVLEPLRLARGRTALFAVVGAAIGEKAGTVKAKYYSYLAGLKGECHPMWEELVNRSRYPEPGGRAKDVRFLDYWHGLIEQTKRLNDYGRKAHRNLLAQLALWEAEPGKADLAIPGYEAPPPRDSWCARSQAYVPAGWSYRQLIRQKPHRASHVNIIVGPQAASRLLPGNLATRAGLKYREIVFTDDQDYDNEVVTYQNRGEAMRPQGFNTLDYLTASFESYGIQLRRRDVESGKRKGIDQEFYVWTVLTDLMRNGFRDDERGTRIIREHGTAKGYAHKDGYGYSFDEIIYQISGGRVSMDASGRFDQGMFAQMFFRGKGRAKQGVGNFRYKAPLESAFRRLRTETANLLGHTGNRYDIYPEDGAVIDGYTRRLFKVIEAMPAAKRELVWALARHHKHTWDEFVTLMALVYGAVNGRRDHRLEGWGAAGYIVPGYAVPNLAQPWEAPAIYTRETFAGLPPEQQHYIRTFGAGHNIVLSPGEARDLERRRDRQIARLGRDVVAAAALPMEWAYPRRRGKEGGVKVADNGTLVIRDPERFGADALIYLGMLHTPEGDLVPLRPGDGYLVHVNPVAPDEALLLNVQGRYRGYVKLMPRPCANDIAARLRTQGAINRYAADVMRDGARRAEPEIARGEEILRHNERVVSGEIAPGEAEIAAEGARLARIEGWEAAERGVVTVMEDVEAGDVEAGDVGSIRSRSSLRAEDDEAGDVEAGDVGSIRSRSSLRAEAEAEDVEAAFADLWASEPESE